MIHTYQGTTVEFAVIHKKRSDIGIYVDIYGQIAVHTPKGTSFERITAELERRWDWLQAEIQQKKTQLAAPFSKVYEPGEVFLYRGTKYPILILPNTEQGKDRVRFETDKICIYVKEQDDEAIRAALSRFYYQQCKSLVQARIRFYQPQFKVKPHAVSIVGDERNWGTCDSNRALTFNWKLAMAPVEVIDYVVVHEMCHMVHMNHDRSFWRLVGKLVPDYEKKQRWLALSFWHMNI